MQASVANGRRLAFVVEEFGVPSPAQQLLDRFLVGYPWDGGFRRSQDTRVAAWLEGGAEGVGELNRRVRDFGLELGSSLPATVGGADAVLVVWRGSGAVANENLLRRVLENARPGAACFVHGVLASNGERARAWLDLARTRGLRLVAGTTLGVTWRLPAVDVPADAVVTEALALVQNPAGDFAGLECLLPRIGRRRGGESGIRRVRVAEGAAFWQAAEEGAWPSDLLAAAIARSDTPQSGQGQDSRLWDIAGRGLLRDLARDPRALLLEHHDGLRAAVLVLDGVVDDYNFAVRLTSAETVSAQVYRPRPPGEHQYSALAAHLEDYLKGGAEPWAPGRGALIADVLAAAQLSAARSGEWIALPGRMDENPLS
ncbi:MAG: hypothetical protein JNG83_06955 [Opitutaceae bacterium]|nr:hypothetical protein [Opitutaceae bacterium]